MPAVDVEILTDSLIGEIAGILGFSKYGFAHKILGVLFRIPARRFAELWVKVDDDYMRGGTQLSAQNMLPRFVSKVTVRGAENIPATGPCLIASNHPGAYDSVAIVANISRPDLKVIISDIPFLGMLPNLGPRFIYAALGDPVMGMRAIREGIRHLQSGGALLIFSTGLVDPDPEVWDEAFEHIANWSSSLEMFMRKAQGTQLILTVASGVVSPKWAFHPLTRFAKEGWPRRRLAEFGQVASQLIRPGKELYAPHLSFGSALGVDDLGGAMTELMPAIISAETHLMADHMEWVQSLDKTLSNVP
jgi:hypothetical protein